MSSVFHQIFNLKPYKEAEKPLWLKQCVSELGVHESVDNISVFRCEDENIFIFADIQRNLFGSKPVNSVQEVERVAFRFQEPTRGKSPNIYIDRSNFPSDLAHLNPVSDNYPASPCISLVGNQALYELGGITLLTTKLVDWLTDAARGTLTHDGWEPALGSNRKHFGDINFRYFQNNGGKYFRAQVTAIGKERENLTFYINIRPEKQDLSIFSNVRKSPLVKGFFLLTPEAYLSPSPIQVSSLSGLKVFARQIGLSEQLNNLLKKEYKFFILIFGIKRPQPLRKGIPGLSNRSGRNIEIVAWLINSLTEEQETKVAGIELSSKVTSKLLQDTSNTKDKLKNCTIIGCGALGSYLAQMFTQAGVNKINLIDNDIFKPHNSARHVLGKFYSGYFKVNALEEILRVNTGTNISSVNKNVCELNSKSLSNAAKETSLIIDATASLKVRQHLCDLEITQKVARIELGDQGELGFLYVEGENRNPRLDDLAVSLYTISDQDQTISQWFKKETEFELLDTGLACASASMRMSGATVQNHASTFFNALLQMKNTQSGIGINVLSNGLPQGWKWFSVPPFVQVDAQVFNQPLVPPWNVRIAQDVLDFIQNKFHNSSCETGGFLYGKLNIDNNTLHIVKAFKGEILSASRSTLIRDKAGKTLKERRFLKNTGKHLILIGSWHTHPKGNANMSLIDEAEARKISLESNEFPRPFLMLIYSKNKYQAKIIYPEKWTKKTRGFNSLVQQVGQFPRIPD